MINLYLILSSLLCMRFHTWWLVCCLLCSCEHPLACGDLHFPFPARVVEDWLLYIYWADPIVIWMPPIDSYFHCYRRGSREPGHKLLSRFDSKIEDNKLQLLGFEWIDLGLILFVVCCIRSWFWCLVCCLFCSCEPLFNSVRFTFVSPAHIIWDCLL